MAAGLTQAQALFAVLAGGAQARRERVYYRDWALRSSLYLVPHQDSGSATAELRNGPLHDNSVIYDISKTTAELNLSFASVRKDYSETGDTLTATIDFDIAMSYIGITYPVYTESSPDSLNATIDFDIAMTYTQMLFPTYTEVSPDSLTATVDFELTITKS